MKQIIMSVVLLLFSLVAMADQYRVELCVFEKGVDNSYFKGIEQVQLAIDRNAFYRYYVGDFEDRASAEAVQKEAVTKGLKYAKVINYTQEKIACANSCTSPDRMQHLLFDYDQYTLRTQSKRDLDNVSYYLQNNSNHKVRLNGHTDAHGSDTYNDNLSQNRVVTAKRYLVSTGIASHRVLINQYGERMPIAKNVYLGQDSPEGRQYNRRVMIDILDELGDKIEGIVTPLGVPELLKSPFFREAEALLTMAF